MSDNSKGYIPIEGGTEIVRNRVLYVEDDRAFAAVIAKALRAGGFEVDVAGDSAQALALVREYSYQLALLDWRLSGSVLDGMALAVWLRGNWPSLGIVMLTGYDAQDRKLQALRTACDDYIVKPGDMAELVARMHAVGRRSSDRRALGARQRIQRERQAADSTVRLGSWHLDVEHARLWKTGNECPLSESEVKLAVFLLARRGDCMAVPELAKEVYARTDHAAAGFVRQVVDRLREKLGPDRSRLEHVHGQGYRLRD
jgi:DNA-binding response OmpR family regulator